MYIEFNNGESMTSTNVVIVNCHNKSCFKGDKQRKLPKYEKHIEVILANIKSNLGRHKFHIYIYIYIYIYI